MAGVQITQEQLSAAIAGDKRNDRQSRRSPAMAGSYRASIRIWQLTDGNQQDHGLTTWTR
jgi:hypothetical protein